MGEWVLARPQLATALNQVPIIRRQIIRPWLIKSRSDIWVGSNAPRVIQHSDETSRSTGAEQSQQTNKQKQAAGVDWTHKPECVNPFQNNDGLDWIFPKRDDGFR